MILPTIPVTHDCHATVYQSRDNARTTGLQVRYGDEWYVCQINRTVEMQRLEQYSTMWAKYLQEGTVYAQLSLNFATE